MSKPVLIFPAGMPRALEFLKKCLAENRRVIGASSLGYDPSREHYPAWIHLPYVSEAGFDEALKCSILEFDIGEIYTPNIVVWNYLSRTLGELIPGVVLANASPVDEVLGGYREALAKARFLVANPLQLSSKILPRTAPTEIDVAALCRYAEMIPGMCDDEKLRALLGILQYSVNGDIVEIGSWWGKSAFVLAWLARCFDTGNLLCVDPWTNDHLIQNEKTVDSGSMQVSAEEALGVFQIGLLPFNSNHINYLRMTSVDGAAYFNDCQVVDTAVFGKTEYRGQISVLHIDGNHSYHSVSADVDSWTKFITVGGWIIFDDYIWPYGNGPQRVGDEFLEKNSSRVGTAFVMGSALFVQLVSDQ